MASQIYRGYDLIKREDDRWNIALEGKVIGVVPSENDAYNFVDKLKRAQRSKQG